MLSFFKAGSSHLLMSQPLALDRPARSGAGQGDRTWLLRVGAMSSHRSQLPSLTCAHEPAFDRRPPSNRHSRATRRRSLSQSCSEALALLIGRGHGLPGSSRLSGTWAKRPCRESCRHAADEQYASPPCVRALFVLADLFSKGIHKAACGLNKPAPVTKVSIGAHSFALPPDPPQIPIKTRWLCATRVSLQNTPTKNTLPTSAPLAGVQSAALLIEERLAAWSLPSRRCSNFFVEIQPLGHRQADPTADPTTPIRTAYPSRVLIGFR